MPVSIDREIARIRGLPGQNWHALAFQALQDYVNGLPAASAPAATTPSKTISIGGGVATSISPTFSFSVNGVLAAHSSVNANNALPAVPVGRAAVTWFIDNTVTPPNLSASYNNLANGLTAVNPVVFSATPVFDASLGNVQEITLTNNVTSFTIINPTAGQVMTLIWLQDSSGGHAVAGVPATLRGFTTPGTTLSTYSAQSFAWDGAAWVATSTGVQNV